MRNQPGTAQAPLPLQRDNDLPPFWDNHRVIWSGWMPSVPATTWDLHHRGGAEQCEVCGSTAPQPMNRGTVHAPTLHLVSSHTTPEHPARIIGTLIAMRCPDCLLDTVVDLTTPDADVWILDESDYHDTGSHDPQETE